jgi:hypothetical protein
MARIEWILSLRMVDRHNFRQLEWRQRLRVGSVRALCAETLHPYDFLLRSRPGKPQYCNVVGTWFRGLWVPA